MRSVPSPSFWNAVKIDSEQIVFTYLHSKFRAFAHRAFAHRAFAHSDIVISVRYHCFILGKKDLYVGHVGYLHSFNVAKLLLNSGKPYLCVSEILRLLFSQLE